MELRGPQGEKEKLLSIISEVKSLVIALQGIVMGNNREFRIPHYSITGGHHKRRDQGGVMLLIHESIPVMEIALQ